MGSLSGRLEIRMVKIDKKPDKIIKNDRETEMSEQTMTDLIESLMLTKGGASTPDAFIL